jgi:hypothetical protein
MGRRQSFVAEMNAPHTLKSGVKLATNPAWSRTQQRRVQISNRRSGSLERCWAALPIVPVGARSVKAAGALVLAADLTWPRLDGPVRFV